MTRKIKHTKVETLPPVCPYCNIPMGKAGGNWSGQNKMQRWRCHGCGGTKTKGPYQGKAKSEPEPTPEPEVQEEVKVKWIET